VVKAGGRWLAAVAAAVLVALGWTAPARAADLNQLVQKQAQSLGTQSLDRYLQDLTGRYPSLHLPTVGEVARRLAARQSPLDWRQLAPALAQGLVGDVAMEGRVVGLVLVLTVLAALLERLADGMENPAVVEVARMVLVSAILLVAMRSFAGAVGTVEGVVQDLVRLMTALVPLLAVLMVGSGAAASAGIFHPLMLATVNGVAVLARQWVLPLLLVATVVELVSGWLPRFSLRDLGALLRQAGGTLLGGALAVFLGVMAVEGAAGAVADGVALRTGKFLAATFVPVVGKVFSDAMEAVLGSSLLLKNAVSVVGAMAIILTVVLPVAKLFVLMLWFRLAAAGAEPLGVRGVEQALAAMAGAVGWLIAVAGAVALMFFLAVTVAVSASNGVVP
jgi:stage III sporulation protein AE